MLARKILCQSRFCNTVLNFYRNASSWFQDVPLVPPVEVFHLTQLYNADKEEKKANLGVGAYRNDEGKPFVLPVVRKAEIMLANDLTIDKRYLDAAGLAAFTEASEKLLLGECHPALKDGRTFSVQCLSGTGALRIAAEYLRTRLCRKTYYVTSPTWVNHDPIFMAAGFENKKELAYWCYKKLTLRMDDYLSDLDKADENAVVIFHTCAHNPTGMDPSQECWKTIAEIVKRRKLFPVFDTAYQGFATGDLDADGWPVRYFAEQGIDLIACQSFAKNFGLYCARIGNAIFVVDDKSVCASLKSQCSNIVRYMYMTPPAHGAYIVSTVLNNKVLRAEWESILCGMSTRIKKMREELRKHLEELKTPGTWNHVTDQVGMFSYSGLSKEQCENLVKKYHIYIPNDGRINVAGITSHNVEYIAKAIDDSVKTIKK